jgi:3',5'-cyclic-AMP phosphodiesterase
VAKPFKRRVIWMTDIHLEFLDTPRIDTFIQRVAAHSPDVVLITGDIAPHRLLRQVLLYMAHKLVTPIYFVLGNHDYYGSDVMPVRDAMTALTRERAGVAWMPAAGIIELAPGVGMVGHGGWGDGGYGDFLASPIILNDYVKIASLAKITQQERLERLQRLGKQAGDYLRGILPEAARQYQHVYVITHAPPFREACWFKGKTPPWDDPYLPHFTCKGVGDALLDAAQRYPDVQFTVLCGHVHHAGEATIQPNLQVITGGAEYEKPAVQQVFVMPLS